MVKAFCKDWKVILRASTTADENQTFGNSYNKPYKHLSANLLQKLDFQLFCSLTSQAHLLRKLILQDIDSQMVYMLLNLYKIDSNTRIFSKLLNNIHYLHSRLFKWIKVNLELCSYFQTEPETAVYLLCSCRKVRQFLSSA